jgi:hypothetical protein
MAELTSRNAAGTHDLLVDLQKPTIGSIAVRVPADSLRDGPCDQRSFSSWAGAGSVTASLASPWGGFKGPSSKSALSLPNVERGSSQA